MRYRIVMAAMAATALTPLAAGLAWAQDAEDAASLKVFTLGEITIQATRNAQEGVKREENTTSVISADQLQTFDRERVDDALALVPGTAAENSGGSRNEGTIFVRGFDRYQVPISIDGIRVYLPADNRLDFSRFLTADVSEVQVAKGYVSVLDGPGALGGAVNLVTRKPTKAFEGEAGTKFDFDSNAKNSGYSWYGLVGTRQDRFYAQASGSVARKYYFPLSNDFTPTANENGGARDHSNSKDYRVNLKLGYTPNATDEYALSYTRQSGSKSAPLHTGTDEAPVSTNPISGSGRQRDWTWPDWNLDSVYFLSRTDLGGGNVLEGALYYNRFYNTLFSYDDATYTTQALARSFDSYYDDNAYGGDAKLHHDFGTSDTLSGAFHYRRDTHVEWQISAPSSATPSTEPKQTTIEDTYSWAGENVFHANAATDVTLGLSYDRRHLLQAEDYSGGLIHYPLADSDAFNWQGAVSYRLTDGGTVHASVSSRTRFPTIFERFSTKFGGACSNPNLQPERALSTEIGYSGEARGVTLEGAVFYNKLSDAIESVTIQGNTCGGSGTLTQSQNVGNGRSFGFEASASTMLAADFKLGGNYSWIDRKITNPADPSFRATGVPQHQAFLYATWMPGAWSVTPSLELASSRWTATSVSTGSALVPYYKTGAYALLNLRVDYRVSDRITVGLSGRNLTDANYQLVDGFPQSGRVISLSTKIVF
jgi:iron complex outermembrane receptor protein